MKKYEFTLSFFSLIYASSGESHWYKRKLMYVIKNSSDFYFDYETYLSKVHLIILFVNTETYFWLEY